MEVSGMNATSTDDRSSAVIVFAGITIFLSVLCVSLRTLIAVEKKIQVRWDDLFIYAATVTSLAQSATWICASQHALGKHMAFVSKADLQYYFEFTYSSQVIGIFAMTFSKISVALLMRRLSIDRAPMLWSGPLASIATWACFSVPAMLFQCGPSMPWNSSPANCPHREGIWFSVGLFNIVTDTFLALYVASKIWNLKMNSRRRATIITLFMSRLVVPIVTMLQVSLASRSFRVEDYTYGSVNFAITTNVAVHLSLITAIVPRIRLLATPSAIRPSTHPTHSTHPLSPARPQNSPNPYLLDLTSTTITSERSRSEDLHNNPCLPQPLTKALSRDTLRSAGENGPTSHLDTKSTIRSTSITTNMTIDDFSLVPTNTLAQLSTTVYRPYTLTETFPSGWTAASEEVEYVRGGFMSQGVVTEPARTLEIGKKTEVKIEIDDVGSSRGNLSVTNVEQPQKRVSPRDILKLEQKRNNQRNDENQVFIRGGFGVYG